MTYTVTRRSFLATAPAAAFLRSHAIDPASPAPSSFPSHDPDTVREVVTVAHGNFDRLKELVEKRPALARVSWDWGYGDWETPIDAASHVGNRPIAEFLLANGARPTVFTAAMMGHLETVKAFVNGLPGVQRIRGPHGLSLMHHARAGRSGEVVAYLAGLGDADARYPDAPLADADRRAIEGVYAFGDASRNRLRVGTDAQGSVTIQRDGASERRLFHHGGLVFNPTGAEAVRLRFVLTGSTASSLVVEDGPVVVEARRV